MTYNSWSEEAYNMGLVRGVIAAFESYGISENELYVKVKSVLGGYMTSVEVERRLKEFNLVKAGGVSPGDVKELLELNKEA